MQTDRLKCLNKIINVSWKKYHGTWTSKGNNVHLMGLGKGQRGSVGQQGQSSALRNMRGGNDAGNLEQLGLAALSLPTDHHIRAASYQCDQHSV